MFSHLIKTFKELYLSAGLSIHDFENEAESQDYGACRFKVDGQKVLFRVAKTTSKKVGQFVVLWKRGANGVIEPYDIKENIDFFVVALQAAGHLGQFIFPKNVLYSKGILSGKGSEGKRAIRVYPAWDITTNRQARNTQKWQLDYFFEITTNQVENLSNIQKRYKYDNKS